MSQGLLTGAKDMAQTQYSASMDFMIGKTIAKPTEKVFCIGRHGQGTSQNQPQSAENDALTL